MNDEVLALLRGTQAEALLLALYEIGGTAREDEIVAAAGVEPYQGHQIVNDLDRRGLITARDYDDVSLSIEGRRVADAIRGSRENGPDRWNLVQREIVADLIHEGVRNASDWGVVEVNGQPVSKDERTNAIANLVEWKYIEATPGDAATPYIRIDVLPKAAEVAGVRGLLADANSGANTSYSNSTVFGDNNTVGGVQQGGSGNTQDVTQTIISTGEREQIRAAIDQVIAALDEEDNNDPQLRASVEELRSEATQPEATKTSIAAKLATTFGLAVASGAGQLVMQGLAQLPGLLS